LLDCEQPYHDIYFSLVQTLEIVTPSRLTGGAVRYTLNEWKKLVRYLDEVYLTPDKNEIERSIKSFVIGRKTGFSLIHPGVLMPAPECILLLKVPN